MEETVRMFVEECDLLQVNDRSMEVQRLWEVAWLRDLHPGLTVDA
jgi:hypothetical protein